MTIQTKARLLAVADLAACIFVGVVFAIALLGTS